MRLSIAQARALGIPEEYLTGDRRHQAYGPPGVYRLTIVGWQPARLNQLMKNRWVRADLQRRDREVVGHHAAANCIPVAQGKRRVTLAITLGKGQRAADSDAYWKSVLDALVACGLLIDDNRQYCELAPVEFARGGDKETTIELVDL